MSGTSDGIGSAALFNSPSFIAGAHTVARWVIGGNLGNGVRCVNFVGSTPQLALDVSTIAGTGTRQATGVALTADDRILYFVDAASKSLFYVTGPLTSSPTLSSAVATYGAAPQQLLLDASGKYLVVGVAGDVLFTSSLTAAFKVQRFGTAAVALPNGTVLTGSPSMNMRKWCCLPEEDDFSYLASVAALPVATGHMRDFVRDTRSDGVFSAFYLTGIVYLTLNPVSHTVLATHSAFLFVSIVDFIHYSGPIYGLLIAFQELCKMSFLPLTPAAPGALPVGGTVTDVAGDGTGGNVDGVGSAARFGTLGYIAAAHTAPAWAVASLSSQIRRVVFTGDLPLRLNVTTLIVSAGKQLLGVVFTNDDSILYTSAYNLQQIQTVFNPLSINPTLGPVLSIVANGMHKISLHPGCESLLLVGCAGEYLLVYNITSQSTVYGIRALTIASDVLANGTVIFGMSPSSSLVLASWCCLPAYRREHAVALRVSFNLGRDFAHDTRSAGLFGALVTGPILYLSLDPISRTVVYNMGTMLFIAMVDFIHCSGPIYGILISTQGDHKMSFLPLTPAAPGVPPVAGTRIDVAGDGTDGNVDGVGSAARLGSLGYVAAAHTVPAWLVAGLSGERFRRVVFTNDVPLRLNVTTIIATPGKQTLGVTVTNDDSILYASIYNLQQIVTVLNPLSVNPTLGPVLSIAANYMHTVSLHPGCESLLLVGCKVSTSSFTTSRRRVPSRAFTHWIATTLVSTTRMQEPSSPMGPSSLLDSPHP